jgi:alkyl hydroperoxide reductase subunit AhpC
MIEGSNVTLRINLIDETGKIFHEGVNDMPLGRNSRSIYGIKKKEKFVPNWEAGKEAMSADRKVH